MSNQVVWLNGQMLPAHEASVSIFDHGLLYGDGVFEGIRIYNGRIFKMKSHLERLLESAATIDLKMTYTADQLERAMRQTIEANGLTDGYIRLCVTRGVGTLGLNPYECQNSTTFVIADKIALYPPQWYESGLAIITAKTVRTPMTCVPSSVKSMNYLNNILGQIEAINANVPEALMLNYEGNVSECTGDNIFIVQGGQIITPPLSAGILPGITRGVVIALAQQAGLTVREEDFQLAQFKSSDEAFLTGTAAEMIAVTKIDDQPIGDGATGPITQQLMAAFKALVQVVPED